MLVESTSVPSMSNRTARAVRVVVPERDGELMPPACRMTPGQPAARSLPGSAVGPVGDVLHRPLVAVGVGEVDKVPPVLDVDVADVHAVVLELLVRGLDVADHKLQAGRGTGRGVVEALADRTRAAGARWRQLDEPEALHWLIDVAGVEIHPLSLHVV